MVGVPPPKKTVLISREAPKPAMTPFASDSSVSAVSMYDDWFVPRSSSAV